MIQRSTSPSKKAGSRDDWDDHWSRFGRAAEIGPSPRYRRRLIFPLLGLVPDRQAIVIELGSGTGELAEALLEHYPFCRYVGLESSLVAVQVSRTRVPSATFLQRDLLQNVNDTDLLPLPATHAVCTEVLEHLDDPVLFVRNAARYMAPGCVLVATVPGGPFNELYREIGHRRHYKPRELAAVLEQAGFRVERAYGAGFPFFNLFRLGLSLRGKRLVEDVDGPPGALVRFGTKLFDILLPLSASFWGWQTIAVARWPG